MIRAAALLALVALLGGTSGQALAAPTWSTATGFRLTSGEDNVFNPRVAANERGDAVIAWNVCYGSADPCVLQSSVRKAGTSAWRQPSHVYSTVEPATLRLDAAGDATAAFFTSGDWPRVSDLPASASQWEPAVTLSPRPFAVWQGPELAVNAAGDAVAAWTGSHGGDLLEVSTRRAGGSWQPAAELAGGNGRYNGLFWSDVSIDPAGNAIVVWTDDTTAHAAVHPAESSFWQPPVTIGSTSGRIEAAFDGAGNATVAWTSAGTIVATYRPLGGTWNTPLQVGTGNVFRLVAGAESGPILAWYDDGGMLYTTSRTPRGAWPISRISPVSRNFLALDLACDARGNAVAVWSDRRATWGAFRPKGGSWHPSQIATPSSSNESASFPSVSLDGSGAAVAVWASDETLPPYDRKIETSELKPDGPLLDSLTVPARAKAGRRIRMSVRALQWGPRLEGAPRWSFGDGLGSGQRVSHIYRRRGIYTVSVSERDASGRTATATATIRIGSR